MIYVKCQTPTCPHKSFALPIPGIERYQRATRSLESEVLDGVFQDNSTLERVVQRLSRSFNDTRSKSALDRWKHRLASEYDFLEILRQLEFSGSLSIDEPESYVKKMLQLRLELIKYVSKSFYGLILRKPYIR
jgi:hypothetical protein